MFSCKTKDDVLPTIIVDIFRAHLLEKNNLLNSLDFCLTAEWT